MYVDLVVIVDLGVNLIVNVGLCVNFDANMREFWCKC